MKYFIPNWEDRLDKNFDFVNDCNSPKRDSPKMDVYAHNIYGVETPYNGIIMSLNIFGDKISVNGVAQIKGYENKTIRDYLKFKKKQKNLSLICDCGAFSYIQDKAPPAEYTVEYISKVYNTLGFDYGVSVDHLIAKNLSKEEKEARRKLSVKNAIEFYKHWDRNKDELSYKPIGAAQGDDANSYAKSVISLINVGYKYIGLGTLIPRSDAFIYEVLQKIEPLVKKHKVKIHLFGVLRKEYLKRFQRAGAKSFDSASYLRKAWLRSDNNYLGVDKKWYSAIRVPIIESERQEKELQDAGKNVTYLKSLQTQILRMLNEFDKGNDKILDEMLSKIMKYDSSLDRAFEKTDKYEESYRNVLESKIWKKCNCAMCRQAGIHIVVFRRTNRNKRRGFHNTYVFYHNYLHQNG